jgi:hypothetical protein
MAGALAIVGLQLLPSPPRVNPPVNPSHTLEANTTVPHHVSYLLRQACMDCHSNETRWPWYSHVAPFSWGVAKDVAKARKTVNFSEWSTQSGRQPAAAVGTLAAICTSVKGGRMPLPKYKLLHSEARLSSAEREAICAWTTTEITNYMHIKRRGLLTRASR